MDSSAKGGYRELLRNRAWLLWEASATSANVGYSVYAISVPWFAFQFSGNFLVVGLVLFIEIGIYSLSFLIGPFVDRARDKRTIFLACYPAQAVASALLGVAIYGHFLTLPLLLGLVAFISFLWDFAWAANNAAPRLLLSQDQLFRASGFGTLLGGATQISGYSAGAVLVVFIGPSAGLLLYAAFLAAAAGLVLPLSIPSPPRESKPYVEEFREGWRYMRGSAGAALRQLATVEIVRGFFSMAPAVLIVVVAAQLFNGNANAYSLLFVAWVLGGVAIALALGEWNPRTRIGPILIGSAFLEAVFVTLAVVAQVGLAGVAVAWFLFGVAGTAYVTVLYVYIRGAFPPDTIGRITSNLYLFTGVAGSVGAFVIGDLAETWSPLELGILLAFGFCATGGLLLLFPRIRSLVF